MHAKVEKRRVQRLKGKSTRLCRRMCSSCQACCHQSSGPPSLSGRPQTVQTPTEDRWPRAGAVEVAVKDSLLWRHRSSITTSHPAELSWERRPGNNSRLKCCSSRSASDSMAQQHLTSSFSLSSGATRLDDGGFFYSDIMYLHNTFIATKDPVFWDDIFGSMLKWGKTIGQDFLNAPKGKT